MDDINIKWLTSGAVGFTAGMPNMSAVCSNGCHIRVEASKTSDALWSKKE
jgi:hypothetical protein